MLRIEFVRAVLECRLQADPLEIGPLNYARLYFRDVTLFANSLKSIASSSRNAKIPFVNLFNTLASF